jgi:hypothetical protein
MGSVPPVLSSLLMIVSGWVNRHQLLVIEFLRAENRLLKGRVRGKRIRFTDAERALRRAINVNAQLLPRAGVMSSLEFLDRTGSWALARSGQTRDGEGF